MQTASRPGFSTTHLLRSWRNILGGSAPILSIEITRECPLHCPGCYAYGDNHLGGGLTLRDLNDKRGDALVEGVLALVRKHRPLHVSLVGGEPLVRHRELSRILPALSEMGVFSMVVTSAVIPIPREWTALPRIMVAVSVDGLPEDHDVRRSPATYERIVKNIEGTRVNIHWTITRATLRRESYAEEYVSFWDSRPEVNRVWVSVYTPQIGESAAEILSADDRRAIVERLSPLRKRYPKFLFNDVIARGILEPPRDPGECLFAKLSVNYSADFRTQVEPCVFGGQPDCTQCGCAISSALHGMRNVRVAGPLTIGHLARGSIAVGSLVNRVRTRASRPARWAQTPSAAAAERLVQIDS
ncbi:MAG TPA: radical SAM protein [Candidatus Solibacter sp.]|nr:radical SAM protein [Candidatus Solibacter sp.]